MANTVEILLDNYNGACYPGQTLCGKVECFFNKEKKFKAIRIKFSGMAKTDWTKRQGKVNVRCWAQETYFCQEYYLATGDGEVTVPAGKHTYPFSYILPLQLPSSYEVTYGKIRYSIEATVDRPWKFNYEHKLYLHVMSPLDLNYVPRLREPFGLSVDKDIRCLWCKSGLVTFNISVPFTGYIPGQILHIAAYVKNMSNVNAEGVEFAIVQGTESITQHPSRCSRYEESPIIKWIEGTIGAHAEKSWTTNVTIPENYYFPNLLPCSIINKYYRLEATVILPFPHTNLVIRCPLTIGAVSLARIDVTLPGTLSPSQTSLHAVAPEDESASLMPFSKIAFDSDGNSSFAESDYIFLPAPK